jgi:hypothetical protein
VPPLARDKWQALIYIYTYIYMKLQVFERLCMPKKFRILVRPKKAKKSKWCEPLLHA